MTCPACEASIALPDGLQPCPECARSIVVTGPSVRTATSRDTMDLPADQLRALRAARPKAWRQQVAARLSEIKGA